MAMYSRREKQQLSSSGQARMNSDLEEDEPRCLEVEVATADSKNWNCKWCYVHTVYGTMTT